MTTVITVEPETGVAVATCTGSLKLGDAKDAARALWNTPNWPGRAVVWDFREARFDFSTGDIRVFADFVLRHQPPTPPERVAWVVPRSVDFGLARMFEVAREDPRTQFSVFRIYEEALAWARSPADPPGD